MSSDDCETKRQALPREAYLYWIHCNRCFKLYVEKKVRFFLLACYHVVCEHCAPARPAEIADWDRLSFKCPLPECGKTVRCRQLGNMMPPHMKELFHPHPWLDHLSPHIQIFQRKHRDRFSVCIFKLNRSLDRVHNNLLLARDLTKKSFEEANQLRRERKSLQKRIRQIMKMRRLADEAAKAEAVVPPRVRVRPGSIRDESGIGTSVRGGAPRRQYNDRQLYKPAGGVLLPDKVVSQARSAHLQRPIHSVNFGMARDVTKKSFEEASHLTRERNALQKRIQQIMKMPRLADEAAKAAAVVPPRVRVRPGSIRDESGIGTGVGGGAPRRQYNNRRLYTPAGGVLLPDKVVSQARSAPLQRPIHSVNSEIASFTHRRYNSFLL